MKYTSRKPRYATKQIAIVSSDSGKVDGVMVDVHEDGAKLQASVPFAQGEDVTLAFSGHELTAIVLWHRDNQMGLRFDFPISTEAVQALNESGDGWVII